MKSYLKLSACRLQERTVLEDVYCEAPYRIMQPFYDGNRMETVIMSSSAGIFGGDVSRWDFHIGAAARVRIKSQSYEKVFQRKEQTAVKKVRLEVKEGGECIYLPYPVIPFAKSRYTCETVVRLAPASVFLYGDIFSCGRVGMEERFEMDWFRSGVKVYVGDRLAFADHTCICPDQWDYRRIGMWQNYTHNGMLYLHLPTPAQEEAFLEWFRSRTGQGEPKGREKEGEPLYWGATRCLSGIGIRVLGMTGERIYQAFESILQQVYEQKYIDSCS